MRGRFAILRGVKPHIRTKVLQSNAQSINDLLRPPRSRTLCRHCRRIKNAATARRAEDVKPTTRQPQSSVRGDQQPPQSAADLHYGQLAWRSLQSIKLAKESASQTTHAVRHQAPSVDRTFSHSTARTKQLIASVPDVDQAT